MIIGLSFFNISLYTQKGVQAVQGVIFMFVCENTFYPMYYVLAEFPENNPLFLREFRSGFYHPAIYYISRVAALVCIYIKWIKQLFYLLKVASRIYLRTGTFLNNCLLVGWLKINFLRLSYDYVCCHAYN